MEKATQVCKLYYSRHALCHSLLLLSHQQMRNDGHGMSLHRQHSHKHNNHIHTRGKKSKDGIRHLFNTTTTS